MDCQCYYCKNNLLDPEEEKALEESWKEIAEGKFRTVTIDELLKEIDEA